MSCSCKKVKKKSNTGTTPVPPVTTTNNFIKSYSDEIKAATPVATMLTDLATVVTDGKKAGFLTINAAFTAADGTATAVNLNSAVFLVTVDGVQQTAQSKVTLLSSDPQSGSITLRVPVAAGPHTVILKAQADRDGIAVQPGNAALTVLETLT